MRYIVVVHEVEGVIKEDAFVGPYRDEERAKHKAAAIERASNGLLLARVEIIDPGSTSAKDVIGIWGPRLVEKVREFRDAGERVPGSVGFREEDAK